jgi:hypothetical protein
VAEDQEEAEEYRSLWSVIFDPTLLALLFAMISLPVVAVTMPVWAYGHQVSAADPARWTAAAGAILVPAAIVGTIAAPIVRWHGVMGGFIALTLAWVLALVMLPVLPALLHLTYGGTLGFGSYNVGFVAADQMGFSVDDAAAGLRSVLLFPIAPLAAPGPFLSLVLGVAYWTRVVRTFPGLAPAAVDSLGIEPPGV